MNTAHDFFLTLDQAAQETGLSPQTIKRFADADYFKCKKTESEGILIDAKDLFLVLNIKKNVAGEPAQNHSFTDDEPLEKNQDSEKLKALVKLQEKYLSLQEDQINNLTTERNWLRERIEKLEAKVERDQIILMSITESNRAMLKQVTDKKGVFQMALEWLGFEEKKA